MELFNKPIMEFDSQKPPTYIKKHPLRYVKPYSHIFKTHAKQRWLDKQILPVLVKQFAAYDEKYFREAIESGKVMINGKKIECNYVVRNSDLLTHSTIRQQPPILDLPIEVIHDDDEFLVISKPPSMIVHSGGGYHYNTLMALLYYEMGYKSLYVLHRIDRLTSGVVIMAKNKGKTVKFHEESSNEEMKKSYFARVAGNFTQQQMTLNAPIVCLSHKEGMFSVYDPATMQDLLKNQQMKESTTKFSKVWYDQQSDSSLLICTPITGRTHQIRVHLKHLGFSILNDVVYGGRFVGNWVIEQMKKDEEIRQQEKEVGDTIQKRINVGKVEKQEQEADFPQEWLQKWDLKTRPWQICLHSFKYLFQGIEYVSSKPYWAEKEAIKNHPKGEPEVEKEPEGQVDIMKTQQFRQQTNKQQKKQQIKEKQ